MEKQLARYEFHKEVEQIKGYTPPQLHEGKDWYIDFYAFDPLSSSMKRKKIKLNYIKTITERRRYARRLIERITIELREGWNPWIDAGKEKTYVEFDKAINLWLTRIEQDLKNGIIRKATYDEYRSKAKTLLQYNQRRCDAIKFMYQFSTNFVRGFLDEIYIERKNSAKTYNNYIRVMNVISRWMIEHSYLSVNPCESIKSIHRSKLKKAERDVITAEHLQLIRDKLLKEDRHFLLACYLEYYCLIRPKEMSMLKLSDINLQMQTIRIRAEVAKNRKDQVVTLSAHVARLMIDLRVFDNPNSFYLFGKEFKPSRDKRSEKVFRDKWIKIRRELHLPETYQFYSLKNTGITDLLRVGLDPLTVRDQARHSSIQITDIYTPHDKKTSNKELRQYKGVF